MRSDFRLVSPAPARAKFYLIDLRHRPVVLRFSTGSKESTRVGARAWSPFAAAPPLGHGSSLVLFFAPPVPTIARRVSDADQLSAVRD
jgi:hypothetical protein